MPHKVVRSEQRVAAVVVVVLRVNVERDRSAERRKLVSEQQVVRCIDAGQTRRRTVRRAVQGVRAKCRITDEGRKAVILLQRYAGADQK